MERTVTKIGTGAHVFVPFKTIGEKVIVLFGEDREAYLKDHEVWKDKKSHIKGEEE